jgi:hypothetical protein
MTKRAEVLTTESPRWKEFADALSDDLCIYEEEWRCDADRGPNVHRYAKEIMAAMVSIDIPGSIEFFRSRSGFATVKFCSTLTVE